MVGTKHDMRLRYDSMSSREVSQVSFFGLVEGQGGFSSADFISSREILKSLCVFIWFHLWYGLGYHDKKCPLCVFCSVLVSASFG